MNTECEYTDNALKQAQDQWCEYSHHIRGLNAKLEILSFCAIIVAMLVLFAPLVVSPVAKGVIAVLLFVLAALSTRRGVTMLRAERESFRENYPEEAALLDEHSAWRGFV